MCQSCSQEDLLKPAGCSRGLAWQRRACVILLLVLAAACGIGVPDYDSRKHYDGSESQLATALLKDDKNAVAYWIEKVHEPSLALCLLLEDANLRDEPVTTEMLDVLLDRGASPNVICRHYNTDFSPLSLAVSLEKPDIVRHLLARKTDPNLYFSKRIKWRQVKPMSTLMLAVSCHSGYGGGYAPENRKSACREIVELLIASNADVNYQGSFTTDPFKASGLENESALMIAAERSDREMVRLLLEKGARKDLKDAYGKTAEMHAADAGHLDLARELTP